MKKITIKIIGLGYQNKYQAHIKIYDKSCLIIEKDTYNGKIEVCLEENKAYKLIAIIKNRILNIVFYIDEKRDCYIFEIRNIPKPITFYLTDFYYENLPIEKGEIITWQK